MGVSRSGRARRIEPVAEIGRGGRSGAGLRDVLRSRFRRRWHRIGRALGTTILEVAPPPLRWFVFIGWKFVLRLRLAPRRSAGTVAGWTIGETTLDVVTLEVDSSLVHARKVLHVESSRLILTTHVWYARTRGRVAAGRPWHLCITASNPCSCRWRCLVGAGSARTSDVSNAERRRLQAKSREIRGRMLALPCHPAVPTLGPSSGRSRWHAVGTVAYLDVLRSTPIGHTWGAAPRPAPVAQRIEHLTTDQKVGGSNPSRRADSSHDPGVTPAWVVEYT